MFCTLSNLERVNHCEDLVIRQDKYLWVYSDLQIQRA